MPGNGSVWNRWFRSDRRAEAASNAAAEGLAVETVGLYQVTRADTYDGSVTYAWNPIVLFTSGDAALGIAALVDPAGDRQAHPANWTRWRRTSEGYDYWRNDAWRAVSSTIAAAPANLRLDGRYAHESCAQHPDGGGVASASWRSLTFDRRGRFVREDGGVSFGPRFSATERTTGGRGSYDITGYRLTLRHDDGQIENHSLVLIHDKRVIWLDGIEYIRQR